MDIEWSLSNPDDEQALYDLWRATAAMKDLQVKVPRPSTPGRVSWEVIGRSGYYIGYGYADNLEQAKNRAVITATGVG